MYCNNCKSIVAEGASFCGQCGARIENADISLSKESNSEEINATQQNENCCQNCGTNNEKDAEFCGLCGMHLREKHSHTTSEKFKDLLDLIMDKNYRLWLRIIQYIPSLHQWLHTKTISLSPTTKRGVAFGMTLFLIFVVLNSLTNNSRGRSSMSSAPQSSYSVHTSNQNASSSRTPPCPRCNGQGKCLKCNGTGYVDTTFPMAHDIYGRVTQTGVASMVCQQCQSLGYCRECNGTGLYRQALQ